MALIFGRMLKLTLANTWPSLTHKTILKINGQFLTTWFLAISLQASFNSVLQIDHINIIIYNLRTYNILYALNFINYSYGLMLHTCLQKY